MLNLKDSPKVAVNYQLSLAGDHEHQLNTSDGDQQRCNMLLHNFQVLVLTQNKLMSTTLGMIPWELNARPRKIWYMLNQSGSKFRWKTILSPDLIKPLILFCKIVISIIIWKFFYFACFSRYHCINHKNLH